MLNSDKERVGLILCDGSIVELDNVCSDPENGFEVRGDQMLQYEDTIYATWHTHPNQNSNLSSGDYLTFLSWPDFSHYIIGTDGVARYFIENNRVLLCEGECSSTGP